MWESLLSPKVHFQEGALLYIVHFVQRLDAVGHSVRSVLHASRIIRVVVRMYSVLCWPKKRGQRLREMRFLSRSL